MAVNTNTKYLYSYDDFRKALEESGLGGSFSDADLRLATVNPDAGMSILASKIGYGQAATDEERAKYNTQAEDVRRQYGGYTGGTAGNLYQLEPVSPGSFAAGEAPSYQNNYNDQMQSLLNKQTTYGSFNDNTVKPVYNNRYDTQIQGALDKVTNPEAFSYNAESDPVYQSYAKAYAREGQRATADALGQAAAMTGGLPSSYAATAAAQAGNYYAAGMADKIPELEQMAYARYQNDYAMKQAALDALMGAEAADYAKFQNDLAQYNADRDFGYRQYLDEYDRIAQDLATVRDMEQIDYAKYLDELAQYNTDRNFGYGQLVDEVNYQTQRRAEAADAAQRAFENDLIRAEAGAAVGDYSGYGNMGYDTSYAEQLAQIALQGQQAALDRDAEERQLILDQWAYQQAQDAADREAYEREWQYQVGQDALDRQTDAERYGFEQQLAMAQLAAEAGDMSYLIAMGITPSSSMVASASQNSAEDSAKYINFVLGYWDEPGVREYITRMTGLSPERYAEYLNKTEEDTNIVYKPSVSKVDNTVAPAPPLSVQSYNGRGTVNDLIYNTLN